MEGGIGARLSCCGLVLWGLRGDGSAQSGLRVLQPPGQPPVNVCSWLQEQVPVLALLASSCRGTCAVCWRCSLLSVCDIHALLPVFELPGCAGCKDL